MRSVVGAAPCLLAMANGLRRSLRVSLVRVMPPGSRDREAQNLFLSVLPSLFLTLIILLSRHSSAFIRIR